MGARDLNRLVLASSLAVLGLPLGGCPLGSSAGGITPEPPTAELKEVNLTARPTNNELASYYCHDLVGGNAVTDGVCRGFFGREPDKLQLIFSFELVFDLGNPNEFVVPLVDLLLALDVFEGEDTAQLGAVCVSFCDPEAEDCVQEGEEACRSPDKDVQGIEDFVPTVEDLIRIAVEAANGTLDTNLSFRYIPAAENGVAGHTEARIRFDLGVDAVLGILEKVAMDSTDDFLDGRAPSFDIPYKARGSVFFDVPVLGRYALSYGPLDGTFSLD
ncbi:MAG: hypothetical protein R3F60_11215 [bacterium]